MPVGADRLVAREFTPSFIPNYAHQFIKALRQLVIRIFAGKLSLVS